jgi:hypothetical protein
MARYGSIVHVLAPAAAALLVIACSSADPQTGDVGGTSENLIIPPGPLPRVCPTASYGAGSCMIGAPQPLQSIEAPGYGYTRFGYCFRDTSFISQLEAMGCSDARYYAPAYAPDSGMTGANGKDAFYIAFCPHAPVDTTIPWAVITTCDACTGEPPVGYVMIGWNSAWSCGTLPGTGCHDRSCLVTSPGG